MTKPRHPEHQRLTEWYGGSFDPDDLNLPVSAVASANSPGDEPSARPDTPKAADRHTEDTYGKRGTPGIVA